MNYDTAHKELVTRHQTVAFLSDIGRVSVRKQHGEYIVTNESFKPAYTNRRGFATLRGAMIAADELKENWL